MSKVFNLEYFKSQYANDLRDEKDSNHKREIIKIVSLNRLRNYRATSQGFTDEVGSNKWRMKRFSILNERAINKCLI